MASVWSNELRESNQIVPHLQKHYGQWMYGQLAATLQTTANCWLLTQSSGQKFHLSCGYLKQGAKQSICKRELVQEHRAHTPLIVVKHCQQLVNIL